MRVKLSKAQHEVIQRMQAGEKPHFVEGLQAYSFWPKEYGKIIHTNTLHSLWNRGLIDITGDYGKQRWVLTAAGKEVKLES